MEVLSSFENSVARAEPMSGASSTTETKLARAAAMGAEFRANGGPGATNIPAFQAVALFEVLPGHFRGRLPLEFDDPVGHDAGSRCVRRTGFAPFDVTVTWARPGRLDPDGDDVSGPNRHLHGCGPSVCTEGRLILDHFLVGGEHGHHRLRVAAGYPGRIPRAMQQARACRASPVPRGCFPEAAWPRRDERRVPATNWSRKSRCDPGAPSLRGAGSFSPREFRRRRAEEAASGWRFDSGQNRVPLPPARMRT